MSIERVQPINHDHPFQCLNRRSMTANKLPSCGTCRHLDDKGYCSSDANGASMMPGAGFRPAAEHFCADWRAK